jgi:transposase-like protein
MANQGDRAMVKGPRRDIELERRWREMMEDQARSGLTISAFCDQRNISASSFHQWKRELKRREGELRTGSIGPSKPRELGGFMPVSIIATATAVIEIDLAGAVVRVRRGFDEEALARVVHVLRGDHPATGQAHSC